MDNKLLFLYPIREYMEDFSKEEIKLLNQAIDLRYRQKGYQIYYAIFPDIKESILSLDSKDTIIKTNTSYWVLAYRFRYPNEYKLLKHLGKIDKLVICGFHLPDCIKKVARVAVENKINTMVDMDLSELFPRISAKYSFEVDNYNEEITRKSLKEETSLEPDYINFLNDSNVLNNGGKTLKKKRYFQR